MCNHAAGERVPTIESLPMAFMLGDFIFLDRHRCPLHERSCSHAMYVTIKWRNKKNTINGQQVTLGRAKTAFLCLVRAAVHIQERTERIWHPLGLLGVSSTDPKILVLRRQKPLTNALDGLYLPRVDCMLQRLAGLKVALCHCRGVHVSDEKVAGGFPSPMMVQVFTPQGGGVIHRMSLPGGAILNPLPLPSALRITLHWDGLHV